MRGIHFYIFFFFKMRFKVYHSSLLAHIFHIKCSEFKKKKKILCFVFGFYAVSLSPLCIGQQRCCPVAVLTSADALTRRRSRVCLVWKQLLMIMSFIANSSLSCMNPSSCFQLDTWSFLPMKCFNFFKARLHLLHWLWCHCLVAVKAPTVSFKWFH